VHINVIINKFNKYLIWVGIGGYYRNMSGKSIKILFFTWCFTTFVFVNIYSSCLTSYMSLTFQRPEINSFRELAANPNYQLVTLEGSNAEIIFLVFMSNITISFTVFYCQLVFFQAFKSKLNNNMLSSQVWISVMIEFSNLTRKFFDPYITFSLTYKVHLVIKSCTASGSYDKTNTVKCNHQII